MRERIGNIDYQGKRTQLIKAKPVPMQEIKGRVYETVDYGWGPTLQDTNVVGGARSKYEQSADAALEADLAESKRRRDTAQSLTTKENQEALLAADIAKKARLGISETYDPPGYTRTVPSTSSTRRTTATTAPEASADVMDIRPDFTSYKPPALDSKSWRTTDDGFTRMAVTSMPDANARRQYLKDNMGNAPDEGVVISDSGKVIRLDPTPRYKAEEGLSSDEMRQIRPALAATRRNFDAAREEQLRIEQVARDTAAAKAEADAKVKQADNEALMILEELKQSGAVSQEVVKGYSDQLEKLQELISSGSKMGPDGRAVPLTEQEKTSAIAEKAMLQAEIRATQNRFSGNKNKDAVSKAILGAIEPGEKPPPASQTIPSHRPASIIKTKVSDSQSEESKIPPSAINTRFAEIPVPLDAPPKQKGLSAILSDVYYNLPISSRKAAWRDTQVPMPAGVSPPLNTPPPPLRKPESTKSFKEKLKDWEADVNADYKEGTPKKKLVIPESTKSFKEKLKDWEADVNADYKEGAPKKKLVIPESTKSFKQRLKELEAYNNAKYKEGAPKKKLRIPSSQ